MAPVASLSYTKGQVDRAGWLTRDLLMTPAKEWEERFPDFDACMEAIEVVEDYRRAHAKPLSRVNAGLRYYVRGIDEVDVTQRLKRFATIVDKLKRQPKMALSRMEDIGGVRAILPTQDDVYAVQSALERAPRWNIRRVRDYAAVPKDDGYRAVHVIVAKDACFVEIQLRTPWQDAWAQSVEQDTRRLRAGLKFGSGPDDLRQYYRMVSERFAMRERGIQPEQEFMEDLAKLHRATRRYFEDLDVQNGTQ